jgi:hypothetical protein
LFWVDKLDRENILRFLLLRTIFLNPKILNINEEIFCPTNLQSSTNKIPQRRCFLQLIQNPQQNHQKKSKMKSFISTFILCCICIVLCSKYVKADIGPPSFPKDYYCILTLTNNSTGEVYLSGRYWYDWVNQKERLDLKTQGSILSQIWRFDLVEILLK